MSERSEDPSSVVTVSGRGEGTTASAVSAAVPFFLPGTTIVMAPRRDEKQYAICKQRGHVAEGSYSSGWGPAKSTCRFCHTIYWTEEVLHEE